MWYKPTNTKKDEMKDGSGKGSPSLSRKNKPNRNNKKPSMKRHMWYKPTKKDEMKDGSGKGKKEGKKNASGTGEKEGKKNGSGKGKKEGKKNRSGKEKKRIPRPAYKGRDDMCDM